MIRLILDRAFLIRGNASQRKTVLCIFYVFGSTIVIIGQSYHFYYVLCRTKKAQNLHILTSGVNNASLRLTPETHTLVDN